jgi:hypothetical protein
VTDVFKEAVPCASVTDVVKEAVPCTSETDVFKDAVPCDTKSATVDNKLYLENKRIKLGKIKQYTITLYLIYLCLITCAKTVDQPSHTYCSDITHQIKIQTVLILI